MHIFLVNDDGIGAVGIMALLRAAEKRGHRVTMCAPKNQMSAASQRITLSDPIQVREYPVEGSSCTAWAIDGTPADCVRVSLCPGGLVTDPVDMVISGINKGENAGTAVHSCCRANNNLVFVNTKGQLFADIAEVFGALQNADKVVVVFIKVGHYLVSCKADLRLS
jgi:hypothetical protein